MNEQNYKKSVKLLLEVLPHALKDKRFALKGGTAINLFHRDFSRLSVDIDLTYLPIENRADSFKNIHDILKVLKTSLEIKFNYHVTATRPLDGKKEAKLIVNNRRGIEIKIEPNYTIRGSLFDPEIIELAPKAIKEFSISVKAQCLNLADTFGGKLCAALDRQHPRDLFDVKNLFENEGLTEEIKCSFIYHLFSHNKPIYEVLNPTLYDISGKYTKEFLSMATVDVTLAELLATRNDLIKIIRESLNHNDQKLIEGFVSSNPDWSLFRDSKIKDYPSVKWKLHNQLKMKDSDKQIYIKNVQNYFSK